MSLYVVDVGCLRTKTNLKNYNMSLYVVDCEADGPVPGVYSMVCFGAVKVTRQLDTTFYAQTAPISDKWKPDALAVSGFSREEHLKFEKPEVAIPRFAEWIKQTNRNGRATIISDNLIFDGMFMSWYFNVYNNEVNPFSWSGRRIGDIFAGAEKYFHFKWKWMRKTTHDHDPVNDAKGNAECIIELVDRYGIKEIPLK
jgi:hypothetical protein